MKQLIEAYNDLTQRFEDWVFKNIVPPTLKVIEIGLKITMIYAFYLLIKNGFSELL